MTDPNAPQADGNASDQTIPLVPEAGFAQPRLTPLPEETLVDPAPPADPWASGPGLGEATTAYTLPLPSESVQPTAPAPAPAPAPAAAPAGPPTVWPHQAPDAVQFGYGSPATYGSTAAGYGPTPTAFDAVPQPAPAPTNTYPQPPYAAYPEPDGPAANIVNQPYAASGYAGQHWPGALDPVAYDYGYGGQPSTPHPNAVTSMVLGILGLVLFTPLAPFAWYLAARGRREMKLDPARWAPSPMLTAGLVMGIIGSLLMVFVGFILLLVIGLAAA
jgi:hypothetical protein